jgi:hypothetical protein
MGVGLHACNPSTQDSMRQDDLMFEANLDYTEKLCLKIKQIIK